MSSLYYVTSESVSEGHPDKVCDRISDEILDYCLKKDENARVACECLATTDYVVIAGELKGVGITDEHGKIYKNVENEIKQIVRDVIKDIGYDQKGFHWEKINICFKMHGQSTEIAKGVDADLLNNKPEGAGDQGIMFGYAIDDAPEFMPAPIYYSHRILEVLSSLRKSANNPGFGPDMKSQVTLKYKNDEIVGVDSIVVSAQHFKDFKKNYLREEIRKAIISVMPSGFFPAENKFLTNPAGDFIIGGPDGDTGLTGRKIIVDTYGGAVPHGGGAFSGKDATKVDRSGAYFARYLAKNIVASKLAKKCLIQISYAIGVAEPTSIYVNTFGTSKYEDKIFVNAIRSLTDMTPTGIKKKLGLTKPIYAKTSSYGHFGRKSCNGFFSWEKTDLIDEFIKFVK